jgi:hypothetical protein
MMIKHSPAPELFINEDVSKLENRINLALFNLMLIPEIREWLLSELGFPTDSIMYPPKNNAAGRPDFVVVDNTDNVVGWVEVEQGTENIEQLKIYRDILSQPVKSLVGPESAGGDLSLERITKKINFELENPLDRQQSINSEVFTNLVNQISKGSASWNYVEPSKEVRNNPFILQLGTYLEGILDYGTPPVKPGIAQVSTITQKGWTIRIYSKVAVSRSVSLLWDQSIGRGIIRIPSYARLIRCLPSSLSLIEDYTSFLRTLGVDIRIITEKQNMPIDESKLQKSIIDLAKIIKEFALIYGKA